MTPGYRSGGAVILRGVTRALPPCWTPERGWHDPEPIDTDTETPRRDPR